MEMKYINKLILILLFLPSFYACAEKNQDDQAASDKSVTQYLKVVGVEKNDTLNIRSAASGKSNIVLKLPNNASGMIKLDESNGWIKLSYKTSTGWAYHKYLSAIPAPTVSEALGTELFCLGTEPHWTLRSKESHLTLKKFDDVDDYLLSAANEVNANTLDAWTFYAVSSKLKSKKNSFKMIIQRDEKCSDEMSDDEYRYSVMVNHNQHGSLRGCCNRKNK